MILKSFLFIANDLLADALTEMFALLYAPAFIVLLPSDIVRIPSKRDATAMEPEGGPETVDNDVSSDHGVHSDLK